MRRCGRQHGAAVAVNLAMSSEFTVQAVSAARANSDAAGEPKQVVAERLPVSPAVPSPIPNPSLRLDPALRLVVIEFRNDPGDAITTSIPSQRQLQAYQRWDVTHIGPTPSGLHHASSPAAPQHAVKESGGTPLPPPTQAPAARGRSPPRAESPEHHSERR